LPNICTAVTSHLPAADDNLIGCTIEVCGSTRTRGYTRTRPVPAGMGRVRVDVLRVGNGYEVHGSGIPVFTRKEAIVHDVRAISNVSFLPF